MRIELDGNKINVNGVRYLNLAAWISLKKLNLCKKLFNSDHTSLTIE
jgi:hypothetical protein